MRFFFRRADRQLVFDIDVAFKQSEENPVYYVQMAHARMCGIFRVGGIDREFFSLDGIDLRELKEPEEQELIKALADFLQEVAGAAGSAGAASHCSPKPAGSLTCGTTSTTCPASLPVMNARLALARATQIVLRNALGILGIRRPSARSLSHINHTR